jgi:hypothetical protein
MEIRNATKTYGGGFLQSGQQVVALHKSLHAGTHLTAADAKGVEQT